MRAKESAAPATHRVRLFRKRQREALKRHNTYIWGLKKYFREHGIANNEWALAESVYDSIEVLNLVISFDDFITAIVGDKKKDLPGVKSIELSTLVGKTDSRLLLIRPAHIPTPRRRK
jgi:hypothetical protein